MSRTAKGQLLKDISEGKRSFDELKESLDISKLTEGEIKQLIAICNKYGISDLPLLEGKDIDTEDRRFVINIAKALKERAANCINTN